MITPRLKTLRDDRVITKEKDELFVFVEGLINIIFVLLGLSFNEFIVNQLDRSSITIVR